MLQRIPKTKSSPVTLASKRGMSESGPDAAHHFLWKPNNKSTVVRLFISLSLSLCELVPQCAADTSSLCNGTFKTAVYIVAERAAERAREIERERARGWELRGVNEVLPSLISSASPDVDGHTSRRRSVEVSRSRRAGRGMKKNQKE